MATKKDVQDSVKAVKPVVKEQVPTLQAAAKAAVVTDRSRVTVPAKSVTGVKQKPEKSANAKKKLDKTPNVLKVKKVKLVRDKYAIPDNEYKQLVSLKERCLTHGKALKKGELLRAGIFRHLH